MTDVVIIGAPRSGTNMLRDVLTSLDGFTTWPCDEINLIWRHGNRNVPSDELEAGHARPEVRAYLLRQFDRVRGLGEAVVEKTCANSLRVEFVHAVVPEAKLVFITRDGYDAAASAMQRWNAPLDVRYTAAKARWMPPSDLPYYGGRFVTNLLRKRRAARAGETTRTVGWWGPKTHDWEELSATRPLDEVCMTQWDRCVRAARRGLAAIPQDQVHHVSYERFVEDPLTGLKDILDFLGAADRYDDAAVSSVRSGSVGKGRGSFDDDARARLSAIGGDTLEALGYER